jgi:outer membrane protein, multidrug efflux system
MKSSRWAAFTLVAADLACVAGCSSPAALRPPVHSPLQGAWEGVPEQVSMSTAPPRPSAWWQVFHDPVLDRLMREGQARNLDIKLAQARILQARAQRRAVAATLWPQFTASADDQFSHLPPSVVPPGSPQTSLQAALNANWNVDLFGVARNLESAAEDSLRASQFDRDSVELTLLGEIATSYLQYRLYQLQYAIATRSAESQAGTVRITRVRFEQGAASRLDLERVQAQLAITRAAVPSALEQTESARSILILLLASTPEALAEDLPQSIPDDPKLPSGDPIDVLLTPAQVIAQRPDVHSAEQQLLGAGANLKAALAERYPQLNLAALFGTSGTAVNQLMTASSRSWSYSGSLILPLFDFGRIRAAIDLADSQQLQAYLTYEQTVRAALQATQSAITLYAQGVLRERQMQTAVDSARIAAQLARRQYQEGALSLLEVLDAERTAYDTELTWSQAAAAVSERLITLYQTMGVLPPTDTPGIG